MTIYYLNEVLQKICIPLARFYYLKNIHVHRFSFIKSLPTYYSKVLINISIYNLYINILFCHLINAFVKSILHNFIDVFFRNFYPDGGNKLIGYAWLVVSVFYVSSCFSDALCVIARMNKTNVFSM